MRTITKLVCAAALLLIALSLPPMHSWSTATAASSLAFTILHTFSDAGYATMNPPVQGTDGCLYGLGPDGKAYKITPNGKFAIFGRFNQDGAEGSDPGRAPHTHRPDWVAALFSK
jgi:hypothetical protein